MYHLTGSREAEEREWKPTSNPNDVTHKGPTIAGLDEVNLERLALDRREAIAIKAPVVRSHCRGREQLAAEVRYPSGGGSRARVCE